MPSNHDWEWWQKSPNTSSSSQGCYHEGGKTALEWCGYFVQIQRPRKANQTVESRPRRGHKKTTKEPCVRCSGSKDPSFSFSSLNLPSSTEPIGKPFLRPNNVCLSLYLLCTYWISRLAKLQTQQSRMLKKLHSWHFIKGTKCVTRLYKIHGFYNESLSDTIS